MLRTLMCLDSPAQVHKFDFLFVYLAGCIDGKRHLPATFSLQTHDLHFGLGDRKPVRQAPSHDHRHHPLQLL